MAPIQSQINKGLLAHAAWKTRLNNAIATGECNSNPAEVAMDNHCDFGKWLYEEIDPSLKNDPYYKEILKLHAEFHKYAARIVEMVKAGRRDDALRELDPKSDFIALSNKLSLLLGNWKKSIAA